MKKVAAVSLVAASLVLSSSAFALSRDSLLADIRAEMGASRNANKTAAQIVEALGQSALAAQISAEDMVSALRQAGVSESAISNGLLNAGYPPNAVTQATAAGNQGSGIGNNGFNGNSSFGQNRASTVRGGGGVSRS